jgi:hypothetical protein
MNNSFMETHTSFLHSHNYLFNFCGLVIVWHKIPMVSYESAHELEEVLSFPFIDFDEDLGRGVGV